MRRLILGFLLISFAAATVRAEEMVRRVQEELRRRQLYFGEVDGRPSPEVEGALRRYQMRKSFQPTGTADDETLKSLGLAAPGPAPAASKESGLPDVPVLKSDAAREVSAADREFLQTLTGDPDLPPVAEDAEPVVTSAKAAPPAVPVSSPAAEWPAEATQFVRDYLAACETNDLAAEMAFYGDRATYFDHGKVGRDFIEKDVRRYYKRWPERKYTLLSIDPQAKDGNTATVRFRIRFEVKNGSVAASGQTANTFTVQRGPDGMKLIALQERRLPQ